MVVQNLDRPLMLCCLVTGLLLSGQVGAEDQHWKMPALDVVGAELANTSPTEQQNRERLERTPGGVSIIQREELERGRTGNLSEALQGTPGISARSRFGQDETRLSIRGSGLGRNFNTRGVRLLRDGLPVTEADGNTRSQLIDPGSADHITVLRGANAMPRGAATLGGAVELHSPTGVTRPGTESRAEGGSFGFGQFRLSNGTRHGERLDTWFTASANREDGWREQSSQSRGAFHGNLGWQHPGEAETRYYLDAQRHRLELPGSLDREAFLEDDRQANPDSAAVDSARDLDLVRFAVRHARTLGPGELQLGAFVQDLRMDHPLPFATIDSEQQDLGLSLHHQLKHTLLERKNRFNWGMLAVAGRNNSNFDFNFPRPERERDSFATTLEVFADNQWQWRAHTALTLSAQALVARREVDESDGTRRHRTYRGLNPRLGVLHEPVDGLTLFANLARAEEPPLNGELVDDDDQLLRSQRSHTLELGTRGDHEHTQWELTAFQSNLQREILMFADPEQTGNSITTNADRTRHLGVEAGARHWLALGSGHRLELLLNWTWREFRFRNDPQWEDNRLPGVPEHEVQFRPLYHSPMGFHLGPVLDYRNGIPVDFANSARTPTTVLWGAQGGYESPWNWSLTFEARNLADRRHVNTVDVTADAREPGQAEVLNPGVGRAFFGGVTWQW